MKKLIFTLFFLTTIFNVINAATGIFEYFLDTKLGSTSKFHGSYNMGTSFNGSNLGEVNSTNTTLVIDISGVKTFKNGGGNVTGATIFYRVYKTGDPAPAYLSQNLPFAANLTSPGDQEWNNSADVNLLANVTSDGTYNVDVYFEAATNEGVRIFGTINSSNPFKATFSKNTVLANELTMFSAAKQNSQVNLSWLTASEKENNAFSIERSKDGRNFTAIGQVKGALNSTVAKDYSFVDVMPLKGVNYYRLKSIELGGKATFSNVVSVSLLDKNNKIFVFPNPVYESVLRMEHEAVSDGDLQITVMDLTGRIVQSEKRTVTNGINIINLNVNNLSGGQYLIAVDEQLVRFVKN
jgi:hypothetical protein